MRKFWFSHSVVFDDVICTSIFEQFWKVRTVLKGNTNYTISYKIASMFKCQIFNTIFAEQFAFCFQKSINGGNYLFIIAKFVFGEFSLEVRKWEHEDRTGEYHRCQRNSKPNSCKLVLLLFRNRLFLPIRSSYSENRKPLANGSSCGTGPE